MHRVTRYLATRRLICLCSLLLFTMVYMSSCKSKRQYSQWGNASFDPTIEKNTVYKQLDEESEVFSVFEDEDTSTKRSSGVAYFAKGQVNLSDSNSAKLNNCRAYFFHGDTLSINIGIGSGFGGWGFIINYKDKTFYTEPYYFTDVIIPGKPDPVYELVYQKLTLNKPEYKSGDSLFGKIDFKSIEIDRDKGNISHTGQGFFRTKVKEL